MNSVDHEHPGCNLLQMAALLPVLAIFATVLVYCHAFAIHTPERGIEFVMPSLPEHSLSEDALRIDIDVDGTVSIAGLLSEPFATTDMPILREHLRSICALVNQHGGLVVRPHSEVQFQRLIDVLSAVTGSGIRFYALGQ